MAKKTKKVDVKAIEKANVMTRIMLALEEEGFEILTGTDFGMTTGTIIVRTAVCDVQIKPITPKSGVIRYKEVEAE